MCVCGAWCLAKCVAKKKKKKKRASHHTKDRLTMSTSKGSTIGNFSCDNVSSCFLWCPVHLTHLKGTPRLFHRVVHILNVGRLGKKERQVRATTQDRSCPVLSRAVQHFFTVLFSPVQMLSKGGWDSLGQVLDSKGGGWGVKRKRRDNTLSDSLSRFLNGCLFPCLLACTGMMCAWGLHHQDGVSDDMCMMRNTEDNEM